MALHRSPSGSGLIVARIAVVRAQRWAGWRRWLPLLLGVWVFVPMTPAMFSSFVLGRLAIGGWMGLFGLLGYALMNPLDVPVGEDASAGLATGIGR